MEEELLQDALSVEKNDDVQEDPDIYSEEGIENYADDDSISPTEEGFMMGYLGA